MEESKRLVLPTRVHEEAKYWVFSYIRMVVEMDTRSITLVACMASLYVIISRLPGFPVLGVEGAKIGLVSTIVPIFGLLLGPWLGASAALLGGFTSRVLFGAGPFTWLTLPAMALSAFVAGCLTRRKVGSLKGWIVAAIVLFGLIFAWYTTWIGQIVLVYPFLHWIAFSIILIFNERFASFFVDEKKKLIIGVTMSGFVATMVAHMYGTLAFIVASELVLIKSTLSPELFLSLIPIVAVERLIILFITIVLGVPILLALRSTQVSGK